MPDHRDLRLTGDDNVSQRRRWSTTPRSHATDRVDTACAVTGKGESARTVVPSGPRKPVSFGDVLEAVRTGAGIEAHHTGEDERDASPPPTSATAAAFPRPASRPPGASTRMPSASLSESGPQTVCGVHQIRTNRHHTADRERSDDGLADADDDVHAHHGREDRVQRRPWHSRRSRKQHDEHQRRGRHGDQRGHDARAHHGSRSAWQHREHGLKTNQPTATVTIGHERDVRAECRQPAIGEQQRLDHEHHRHAEHGRPRTDQRRREHPPEQVAAGPSADREVQHLDGEDERCGKTRQRRRAIVELVAHLAQRDPDTGGRNGGGGQRRRCVEEAVGHVHVVLPGRVHRGPGRRPSTPGPTWSPIHPNCKMFATVRHADGSVPFRGGVTTVVPVSDSDCPPATSPPSSPSPTPSAGRCHCRPTAAAGPSCTSIRQR